MATPRHLERAPIVEALIDFRVALPPTFRAEAFGVAKERLGGSYPLVQENRAFTSHDEGGRLRGYFFRSADERNVVQFRIDGFTLNRLAPYTDWRLFRHEALSLWQLFLEIAAPSRVDRLAVRYINRMELPASGNLAEFLEVRPPQFPGAPKYLSTFLLKESCHDPENGQVANIVESLEYLPDMSRAVLTMDIDAYTGPNLDVRPEVLGGILDQLREMKNQIFFGTITENTARIYE